ncbi:hypothetical protein BZA70DRAFT_166124 [Myxozyma melibiosi]|uniref:Uncharacterized protein n=1 Tax=Myxozyma melibiosi TaxID=54550 RepID=A0ABR1F749_9ASCO
MGTNALLVPTELVSLLGVVISNKEGEPALICDDNKLAGFLASHGLQTDFSSPHGDKEIKGIIQKYGTKITYIVYYEAGLALCFQRVSSGKALLESIEIYNTDRKYKAVASTLLPFKGLTHATTASELIEAYMEPTEKGGGVTAGIDIWLRWSQLSISTHEGEPTTISIDVQISDRSWQTGGGSVWKSMTISLTS